MKNVPLTDSADIYFLILLDFTAVFATTDAQNGKNPAISWYFTAFKFQFFKKIMNIVWTILSQTNQNFQSKVISHWHKEVLVS